MVTQDTSLLHRSLRDNIRYGRLDASDEEIIESAKIAGAHDFIVTLDVRASSVMARMSAWPSVGSAHMRAPASSIPSVTSTDTTGSTSDDERRMGCRPCYRGYGPLVS